MVTEDDLSIAHNLEEHGNGSDHPSPSPAPQSPTPLPRPAPPPAPPEPRLNRGAELLRGARGSQTAKARRLGVSQPFISLLCMGKKVPGESLRAKLSTLYQ